LGVVRREGGHRRPPDPAVAAGDVPLGDDDFWVGDPSTLRLRAVHVTAWCALLGLLALYPVARYSAGAAHAVAVVLAALDVLALGASVVAVCSNAATGRGGSSRDRLTRPLVVARWVAVGLLAASLLGVALLPFRFPRPPTHLPGMSASIAVMFVSTLVLLATCFACVAPLSPGRRRREHPGYAVAMRGFASATTALLGWLVGGAFTAGIGLWAAEYLGTPVTSTRTALG